MKQNSVSERLVNGIVLENPTFVLMLGMCPTLAVTTSAINGLGMGLTTMVVLALSNMFISMLRNIIPDKVRIPAFIVIIASFVTVVELLEKGNLRIREIPLKPLRDMRKLKGTYMEITSLSSYQDTNTEDYVQITLTDEEDIVDGMQKLRTVYPNLMRLEYDNRRTRENQEIAGTETVKRKSELEYFEEFFELQNNQPMNEEQRKYSEDLIRKIQEVKQ